VLRSGPRDGLSPSAGLPNSRQAVPQGSIPLIHTTDLYHPPQDPDDQLDLATVCALPEYDLLGVVLDVTERFLYEAPRGFDIRRKPGHVSVAQMAHITGKTIPVAQGPVQPLRNPGDTCLQAPAEEQAGVEMILDFLSESARPVTISVTGSPRALTAAYNREPALLKERTRAVLLNAGSTGGERVEWNVQLDLHAYVGLWRSELPIHWFPPGTDQGAFDPAHERGTYWRTIHAELFRGVPPMLERYFAYALRREDREDPVAVLAEPTEGESWQEILQETRNLWSTASLVMGADRELVRTEDGWRFLPAAGSEPGSTGAPDSGSDRETWPWRLDPIDALVSDDGTVAWEAAEGSSFLHLFGRMPGRAYGEAMTEALNALFRSIPLASRRKGRAFVGSLPES